MKMILVSAVWAVTLTLTFLVFSRPLYAQNRDMTDYLKSGIVTLYAHDFYAWTQEQAALLREGAVLELDLDNLAEEIESLGKSQYRELGSRADVLLMHLLKWCYQASERSGSWRSTIRTQRRELRRLLAQNPSLRPLVESVMVEGYPDARLTASDETGVPVLLFPEACPWTAEQVLDGDFWPGVQASTARG